MSIAAPSRRLAGLAVAVLVLVLALVAGLVPEARASEGPPDQLDPPAPGEADYPEDPSEPAGARTYAAQPAPRFEVAGTAFPALELGAHAGSNRFRTSVETSRAGWPDGAPAAVLATGQMYADALVASSLAGTVGGPLLLTPTESLDGTVADELARLQPAVVYVIGHLTAGVEEAVAALGHVTERVGGSNPYVTATAVSERAIELGADPSTLLVASGEAFPDALAASAIAAALHHPILLVPAQGGAQALHDHVDAHGTDRVLVVGGTAVVPDETVAGLPGVERLSGRERTETAKVVADRARALGLRGTPVLAGAETFPDGLTGGVLAGSVHRAPVLLTYRSELSGAAIRWVAEHGVTSADVVGGPAAVSRLTRCQAQVGDSRALLCIESELERQGYHVGAVDGRLDHQSVWAFLAFQKVAGLPVDGRFDEGAYRRLLDAPQLAPVRPDLGPDHVEIDIARQLVLVVQGGEVRHALHTSTGKRSTPTVRGVFSVYEKRNYRQANRMYRPVFFYRGYAFHGYPEIPLYPASAGCARLYDGDMNFLWPFLQIGTRVASY
jgi:putative cell wall-binding protein